MPKHRYMLWIANAAPDGSELVGPLIDREFGNAGHPVALQPPQKVLLPLL
jgi:hypothetical protein